MLASGFDTSEINGDLLGAVNFFLIGEKTTPPGGLLVECA